MTSTAPDEQKNHLTAKDICSIIKVSGKSGLSKLVYQGLHLEFRNPTAEIVDLQSDQITDVTKDLKQLSFGDLGNLDSPKEPEGASEVEDMHLAVSDPVAWERKHLEGIDYGEENGHNEA